MFAAAFDFELVQMGWFLFEWELHLRTIFCEWLYYSGDKDGMAAPLFSQVKEFNGEKEEWCQYMEWLDHFFQANEVTNVNKKRVILLKMIGPSAYKLLRNLLAPAKLKEKTYVHRTGGYSQSTLQSKTIRDGAPTLF